MSRLHKISGCDNAERKADVVFMHGLGGDAFTTWRHGEDDSTSWPHWLGQKFPDVAVWSLGYAASPTKWNRILSIFSNRYRDSGQGMALPDRALQVLDLMVQRGLGQRPLLFIGHSLGGLLAKQILRTSFDAEYEPSKRNIFANTRAVLFLSTPHLGASLATLLDAFRTVFGATITLQDLCAHDAHLLELYNWYRHRAAAPPGIQTVTYYEKRGVNGVIIVNPSSAHPGVGADPVPLDENHISIAKPRERDAQVCSTAEELLRTVLEMLSPVPIPIPPVPLASHSVKVVNSPPTVAPGYFQDRHEETQMIADFLRDNAQRLLIVTGGVGMGKTTTVCRLLSAITDKQDIDGTGRIELDGVVYLSANGYRRINAQNLLVDLCKLLPADKALRLEMLFSSPQVRTMVKMQALLGEFSQGCATVLLDNFEDLLVADDPEEKFPIRDIELDDALRVVLDATQHTVKLILTTPIPPLELMLHQPGRHGMVFLEEGLCRSDTESVLCKMDRSKRLHLESASQEFFDQVFELTKGHPRALELLSTILRTEHSTTLDPFLQHKSQELTHRIAEVLVGEVFERQDPRTQHTLMVLAIYGRPVSATAVNHLIHPHFPEVNSERLLRRLVTLRLARNEAGNYYLYPFDRTYALSKIPHGESIDRMESNPPKFTQIALLHRGAEFFKCNRESREATRTFEDLNSQIVEFDLRCDGEEYEVAANILIDIDTEYLVLWGQSPLVVSMYERLLGNLVNPQLQEKCIIDDSRLRGRCLYGLGFAQYYLGRYQAAITCLEMAFKIACSEKILKDEGLCLAYLGSCNFYLGRISEAITYEQKALHMVAKISDLGSDCPHLRLLANGRLGACFIFTADDEKADQYLVKALDATCGADDRRDESFYLDALGLVYCYQGKYIDALRRLDQAQSISKDIGDAYGLSMHACNRAEILNYQGDHYLASKSASEALQIGYGSLSPVIGSWSNVELAIALFKQGDIENAHKAASDACKYDAPLNSHIAFALLGLIMLRLGDCDEARKTFIKSIELADLMLSLCTQNYYALEAKGLSLSGLVLCGERFYKPEAIKAYREARQLSKSVGRLRRSQLLFDTLPDSDNLLGGVRQVAVGG